MFGTVRRTPAADCVCERGRERVRERVSQHNCFIKFCALLLRFGFVLNVFSGPWRTRTNAIFARQSFSFFTYHWHPHRHTRPTTMFDLFAFASRRHLSITCKNFLSRTRGHASKWRSKSLSVEYMHVRITAMNNRCSLPPWQRLTTTIDSYLFIYLSSAFYPKSFRSQNKTCVWQPTAISQVGRFPFLPFRFFILMPVNERLKWFSSTYESVRASKW